MAGVYETFSDYEFDTTEDDSDFETSSAPWPRYEGQHPAEGEHKETNEEDQGI